MTNPFETLRKILQNEAARGYDDKGMVGGIDKFIPAFEQQARKANVEEALIAEVVGWMKQYSTLSMEDRAKAMSDLLARLPMAVPSPQRPPASANGKLNGEMTTHTPYGFNTLTLLAL